MFEQIDTNFHVIELFVRRLLRVLVIVNKHMARLVIILALGCLTSICISALYNCKHSGIWVIIVAGIRCVIAMTLRSVVWLDQLPEEQNRLRRMIMPAQVQTVDQGHNEGEMRWAYIVSRRIFGSRDKQWQPRFS